MNETDFIRRQLAAERAHLREVLEAVCEGDAGSASSGPVAVYVDWAGRRLLEQLAGHQAALRAAPSLSGDTQAQLLQVAEAASRVTQTAARPLQRAQRLLQLLDAWSDGLDELAGRTLRIAHWRRAAHLNADAILEERRLYAAARLAMGVS
ncbi:MAG TPA: hypothetical protein VMC02_08550 [Steroidobacteraceae bacterium]|nr:hypothetical protein [Steroidobacteraceae bacterium]